MMRNNRPFGLLPGLMLFLVTWTAAAQESLSTLAVVRVREFRFEGNTVFTSAQLARVVASYTGRDLTAEELEDARRAVTLHYINQGYLNSGAILPNQKVIDGVITLHVIEGVLSEVNITGNRWLRDDYIRSRLQRWAGRPLNMNELKEGLQLMRQNPNVSQINAELRPGTFPGESLLDVRVTDLRPYRLALQVDNARPPSVGSEEILILSSDRNLTGHNDPLDVTYGIADGGNGGFKFSGFDNVSGSYAIPFTVYDTTLRVYGSKSDYTVLEEPFNELNIKSESYRVGAILRQPIYQTANRELALAVTFERHHSKSYLLGQPFDVSPGSTNGVMDVSVLRFSQEWIDRNQDQVFAMRSTFSFGTEAFGVTDNGTDRDATFFAWLGQAQYVRRLFNTRNQVILRTDAQLTSQPLLSLEQIAIGGSTTVRGYLENQLVRDQGVISSIEFRVPVVINQAGLSVIQLAAFFDFGGGWNNRSATPQPQTISGIGVGLLLNPVKRLNSQLYWGHPFTQINTPNDDPQDLGLYFRTTFEAF